ncbi:MAG TPA: DUF6776 family protein [Steroidobacteraceae bacterium]|nr:hypothetical protein [Gammaproteobacteria bacterium]HEV2286420.1 DUF6776 family protein [Steroidobacteraceae bacterium]
MRLIKAIFGKDEAIPQVVHRGSRVRRALIGLAVTLIAAFGIYVVYELGRYNAGYDRQAVAQQRTELEVKIEHMESENRELRTKLAELDTIRLGRAREQSEVARAMGDLQAQVAKQSQELAFYRGVVAQGAASVGVKVEELRISASPQPGVFVVHMALVRSGRAETLAAGTVQLSVDGDFAGGDKTLDLATLSGGRQHDLRYDFRYFQDFDQEVTLPAGFKPAHLVVEVQSNRHDVTPLSQTFLWSVEAAP